MPDIVKTESRPLAEAESSTERLIRIALEKGLNPTELYSILERERQTRAVQSYNIAKGDFIERCPKIVEKKIGGGITKSGKDFKFPYADLSDIIEQAFPALRQLGFSWDFSLVVLSDNKQYQRCYLRHRDGHVHTSDVPYLADGGGHMNAVQQIGSGLSYAERYALLQALGLPTTKFDADSPVMHQQAGPCISDDQIETLNNLLIELADKRQIPHEDQAATFKAGFKVKALSEIKAVDFDRAAESIKAKMRAAK